MLNSKILEAARASGVRAGQVYVDTGLLPRCLYKTLPDAYDAWQDGAWSIIGPALKPAPRNPSGTATRLR